EVERSSNRDPRAIRVARQMISPAVEFPARVTPQTFKRQKDITALPTPVQPVKIGIERMTSGERSHIGMVQMSVQSHGKANGAKFTRRNLFQPERVAILLEIEPSNRTGKLQPRAIRALQCEIAKQITGPRDGKGF